MQTNRVRVATLISLAFTESTKIHSRHDLEHNNFTNFFCNNKYYFELMVSLFKIIKLLYGP
jgi:hypothetical protein